MKLKIKKAGGWRVLNHDGCENCRLGSTPAEYQGVRLRLGRSMKRPVLGEAIGRARSGGASGIVKNWPGTRCGVCAGRGRARVCRGVPDPSFGKQLIRAGDGRPDRE